jgi:hypothetical protein
MPTEDVSLRANLLPPWVLPDSPIGAKAWNALLTNLARTITPIAIFVRYLPFGQDGMYARECREFLSGSPGIGSAVQRRAWPQSDISTTGIGPKSDGPNISRG